MCVCVRVINQCYINRNAIYFTQYLNIYIIRFSKVICLKLDRFSLCSRFSCINQFAHNVSQFSLILAFVVLRNLMQKLYSTRYRVGISLSLLTTIMSPRRNNLEHFTRDTRSPPVGLVHVMRGRDAIYSQDWHEGLSERRHFRATRVILRIDNSQSASK